MLSCLGNKERKLHEPGHAFHSRNTCAVVRLHTKKKKKKKSIDALGEDLAAGSSLRVQTPCEDDRKATPLCS